MFGYHPNQVRRVRESSGFSFNTASQTPFSGFGIIIMAPRKSGRGCPKEQRDNIPAYAQRRGEHHPPSSSSRSSSSNNLSNILTKVVIQYRDGNRIDITDFKNIKQEFRYPNTEFKLGIPSKVEKNYISGKYFIFKHYEGLSEDEILLEDKKQTGFRFQLQKGDKIKHTVGHYVEYILEFDEETFAAEYKNKDCAIYPIGGYKECDKKSIRKSLDDLGLNKLTPIWATASIDEIYC